MSSDIATPGDGKRLLLGITGGPGSGKSTFAARLVGEFADKGVAAVALPMDGFHLPDAVLASRGLADVKGAPATFDRAGLEALLDDAARPHDHCVRARLFARIARPVPGAIAIPPETQIVLVEGNYLGFWPSVRDKFDEIWKLELPGRRRASGSSRAASPRVGTLKRRAGGWIASMPPTRYSWPERQLIGSFPTPVDTYRFNHSRVPTVVRDRAVTSAAKARSSGKRSPSRPSVAIR